jgi:hypothetical protein
MAGNARPKCVTCGKYFKFNWDLEIFESQCDCKGKQIFDNGEMLLCPHC